MTAERSERSALRGSLSRFALVAALIAVAGSVVAGPASAAEQPEVSVTLLPVRYIGVDGDASKFRAHHWMNDGYAGGVKDFSAHYTLPDGTWLSTEAHAIPNQNDYGTELLLKKDGLGFLNMEYEEFRKYYASSGGIHRRFTDNFQSFDTDKELALDIGKFGFDTALTLEGWPEFGFAYEREFKDGAKSRLTWAFSTQVSEARKITPSWQDIDEVVDAFTLHANQDLGGFNWHAEQRWELARSESVREERQFSSNPAAADSKIRRQDQAPESTLMTTTVGGTRHFLNEKAFVSTAYRFAHLKSREFETLAEFNSSGVPANFSNPEQKPNNRADNDYDSHTWVGSFSVSPLSWLQLGSKLKTELIKRHGNSTYNRDDDANTPDGIVNGSEYNNTDLRATRIGEGVSLQITAIPRTALYTELEMEQSRALLREDRQSLDGPDTGNGVSANEVFTRETVTDVRRGAGTIGARTYPWPWMDVTAHVRRRVNDNDYDDQRESLTAGRSAFMDMQNIHTNEFVTRLTLKPRRWLRTSFRYQLRDDDYITRTEARDTVKTGTLSHIYTYDLVMQPTPVLSTTTSFSRQTAATTTPASLSSTANIPTFNADVNSWLLGVDYSLPKPAVGFYGTLLYSRADNFDDYADTGMPYGVDNERLDLTAGLRWTAAEDTTMGLEYAFYHFQANSNAEVGDYDAHGVWLEVTRSF